MKRMILAYMLLTLITPVYGIAGIIAPARVTLVEGDIMFRTVDNSEWLPASINTPLDEGDAVWCQDGSKTEIQLPDGTLVRLDGGSQLDLVANESGFVHLHLASGRLYLRTAQTSATDSLQIDADDTTVLPSPRTRLRLDMLANSQEDVSIFKGSAYVEGNGNRTRVRAGEHLALEEGHSELLPLNPVDSWEEWNIDRDRLQSRAVKAESNLPDELRSYSEELEMNGSWVTVPVYGLVWRPTLIVVDDWGPYRYGRWFWRGNDYIWISYESWGWLPYHFGRWLVITGFGWCWVPPARGDIHWGPGYVGWYRSGSHIGWTPLAPGEIFYGYGHYGRHSVNITNTTVNINRIEYRNRHVRGGVTVLPQSDFLRGRISAVQAAVNQSLSLTVSVGSPRIRPVRDTGMPIVQQIPPKHTPPKTGGADSRDLRQRFPRISPGAASGRHLSHPSSVTAPSSVSSGQSSPAREIRSGHQAPPPVSRPEASSSGTPLQGKEESLRTRRPATTVQENAPQREEKSRRGAAERELKKKKIWKVITPESAREKEFKARERKDR